MYIYILLILIAIPIAVLRWRQIMRRSSRLNDKSSNSIMGSLQNKIDLMEKQLEEQKKHH